MTAASDNEEICELSSELIEEIAGYEEKGNSIVNEITKGQFKGKTNTMHAQEEFTN